MFLVILTFYSVLRLDWIGEVEEFAGTAILNAEAVSSGRSEIYGLSRDPLSNDSLLLLWSEGIGSLNLTNVSVNALVQNPSYDRER